MKEEIKEIDIFEASRLLFKSLIKLLINIINFFVRRFWLLVLITLGGILIGFGLYSFMPKVYQSEMVVLSNTLNSKEMVLLFNDWDWKNDQDLNPNLKSEIKSMYATYVLDLNRDSIWDIVENTADNGDLSVSILKKRMKNTFAIVIEIYKPNKPDSIQDVVMQYIEKDKKLIQLHKLRIDYSKLLLDFANKEIEYIDSLQKLNLRTGNQERNQAKLALVYESQKVYDKELLSLLKLKNNKTYELAVNQKPFNILKSFQPSGHQFISWKKYIGLSALISFLLAFILGIVLEIRRMDI